MEQRTLRVLPFLAMLAIEGEIMFRIKIIAFLFAALVFAGCAKESAVTYTPPPLDEDWTVSMHWSGGIAGVRRNISVKSDGNYRVSDEISGMIIEEKLTDGQLSELEEMLTSLEFTALKIPGVCADCFVYDIEVTSGGRKLLISVDDVSLGDSGAGPLVQFLTGLITSALQ
jgi:hypothetical protein